MFGQERESLAAMGIDIDGLRQARESVQDFESFFLRWHAAVYGEALPLRTVEGVDSTTIAGYLFSGEVSE